MTVGVCLQHVRSPAPPLLLLLQATYQLQWPAIIPKRLDPRFVPLAEAEAGECERSRRRAAHRLHAAARIRRLGLAPKCLPSNRLGCCLLQMPAAIGNGAGNPDFRLKRTEEDGPEEAAAVPAALNELPNRGRA